MILGYMKWAAYVLFYFKSDLLWSSSADLHHYHPQDEVQIFMDFCIISNLIRSESSTTKWVAPRSLEHKISLAHLDQRSEFHAIHDLTRKTLPDSG